LRKWRAPTNGSEESFHPSHCRFSFCTVLTTKRQGPAAVEHFYNAVGSPDKTLKLYDGYFHDLLNDKGKNIVMADIRAWITERILRSFEAKTGTAG
jgi:hypothetical protein